jgi:hypothetical protein
MAARGCRQPALAVIALLQAWLVEPDAIPELAGDRLVHLVEPLAVIRERALPDLRALAGSHLQEPVGIGERLPRGRNDVRRTRLENAFRLREAVDAAGDHDRRGEPGGPHGVTDPPRRRDVPPEGTGFIGEHRRHALPAARAGVRIRGPSFLRLLRVLELAAARQRQKVHPGARELDAEEHRIVHAAAAVDALVGKIPASDDEALGDAVANGAEDLERQARAVLSGAAIAVAARVSRRQEGRHRVRVSVVQLDAVEAGGLGAAGGGGEDRRKRAGQVADVRLVRVGHTFAQTEVHRFYLTRAQNLAQPLIGQREQPGPLLLGRPRRRRIVLPSEQKTVAIGDAQVPSEIGLAAGTPADREEVDDLDEQLRASAARAAHGVDQLRQSRDEAIVADAQQRTARNVTHAGGLDDERRRLSLSEALVPAEHAGRNEAVVSRPPRHHRRHPRPVGQLQPSHVERTEERRRRRARRVRPC